MSDTPLAEWVLLPESESGSGWARLLAYDGRSFAVFAVDGRPVVVDDACPHKSGPLSEGLVHGEVVTCPFHWYSFDLRSGACRTTDEYKLRRYAVEQRAGQWWVEIPPLRKQSWSEILRAHAAGNA